MQTRRRALDGLPCDTRPSASTAANPHGQHGRLGNVAAAATSRPRRASRHCSQVYSAGVTLQRCPISSPFAMTLPCITVRVRYTQLWEFNCPYQLGSLDGVELNTPADACGDLETDLLVRSLIELSSSNYTHPHLAHTSPHTLSGWRRSAACDGRLLRLDAPLGDPRGSACIPAAR